MRYAIVESGGKQYKAVEGQEIDVDRLTAEAGSAITLRRVFMMADDDDFRVGSPMVDGIEIRATVVDHIAGQKLIHFRYSPKKRIRVKAGHRQQYTRLRVDFIGAEGESRPSPARAEMPVQTPETAEEGEAPASAPDTDGRVKKTPAKKAATRKVAPKRKTAAGKSTK